MSQTFKLFRLQQIDTKLDQMRFRINELERILADDRVLRSAQAKEQEERLFLENSRKSRLQAENILKQQRLKIEQTDAKLYGGKVKNPKELQDLQNESLALRRYRSVLEDRLLETMIAEEEAEISYKQTFEQLNQIRSSSEKQILELSNEREQLLIESNHFEDERRAAVRSITKEDLSKYDHLRTQRNGIAVTKIIDKSCAACGSILNATLLHQARIPEGITCCDTCGRMLYSV